MSHFTYLRTFLCVYRTGSYGSAANVLNMTHPTVSKHISILEQQLGKPLFKRVDNGGKSYKSTKVAKDLAKELSSHIDKIEEIFSLVRGRSDELKGTVHIGGLSEFVETHLTDTTTTLMLEDIHFVIQYEGSDQWSDALEEQATDISILPIPITSEMIGYRELFADPLVLVAHTELCKGDVDISNFIKLPYIAYAPELLSIKHFIAGLPIDDDALKVAMTTGSFRMIKDLLLKQAGFSIVPQSLVHKEIENEVLEQYVIDSAPIYMRLYLAWNKNSMQKPRNIFVRDAILDALIPVEK